MIEVQSFLDASEFVVSDTMDQTLDRVDLGTGAEADGLADLDTQLAVSHLEDVLDVVLLAAGGNRVAVVVAEDGLLIWLEIEGFFDGLADHALPVLDAQFVDVIAYRALHVHAVQVVAHHEAAFTEVAGLAPGLEVLGVKMSVALTYLRYIRYADLPPRHLIYMKRAALYMRVSTLDQHPETQLYDLRQMAQQRGYQIVEEYTDTISGARATRPGLDQMMRDARRVRFDVVLVWASDRIARSVKHFLDVLDELNRLNIEFISFREQIDTGGPLGRAVVVIIGAIAELERNLIIERVRAGMRRARLEGRHIGRKPLELDRTAILRDRQRGQSLGELAKSYRVSRATIHRVLREHAPTTLEKSA